MKCPECGENFTPLAVNQKYCSAKCGEKYRRKHPETVGYPVISFRCANCNKAVVTDGKKDKRTRFCSEKCEKKFWRHPPQDYSGMRTQSAALAEWHDKNVW